MKSTLKKTTKLIQRKLINWYHMPMFFLIALMHFNDKAAGLK